MRLIWRKKTNGPGVSRAACTAPRRHPARAWPEGRLKSLRNDPRLVAGAFDIDALADAQARVRRLRDRDEHAILHAHENLLRRRGLVIVLRHFITAGRAAKRPENHGDVPAGSSADQA